MRAYDRNAAVNYARKWALSRNSVYKDYEKYGGNCTNFISQCLVAGGILFDHQGQDLTEQWYWYSDGYRTPSFTSATSLKRYLLKNNHQTLKTKGVYAIQTTYANLTLGDIVFKSVNGKVTHSMIVTGIVRDYDGNVVDYLICQHSYDLKDYPLSQKEGEMSYIKILGCYDS